MTLKKLTDQNLDKNLKELVVGEREILAEIILHIIEVECRKLYLKFGYGSLFEYLTQHIGYANGSAQRRIDAARLAMVVPKVVRDLESGELKLAQVSLLQKSIRAAQLESKTKVDQKMKVDLVDLLSNKSLAESEVIVAQMLDIAPMETTKIKNQKDESVRLEVTLTKSQWQKLLRMREVLSNSLLNALPLGSDWGQVLECAADQVIRLKDKYREKRSIGAASSTDTKNIKNTELTKPTESRQSVGSAKIQNAEPPPASPPAQVRKYIAISIKRKVFQRDQCCQYIDKVTGRKCESRWHLQIDHIQPVWANGTNALENLRLLCAGHNQQLYRWQANIARHH